jgi:hypothetical protein
MFYVTLYTKNTIQFQKPLEYNGLKTPTTILKFNGN